MDVLPGHTPSPPDSQKARSVLSTALGVGAIALVCVLGFIPTLRVLSGGQAESLRLEWDASHGAFSVGLDALSAFFLVPVLGLSALAAVYGGNYLLPYRGKKS